MPEQLQPLSQTEYDTVSDLISKAIYEMVLKCPVSQAYDVKYATLEQGKNIAVIPYQENAGYKKKYVSGSFEAKINFDIAYKSSPTEDSDKFAAQTFVAKIMSWIEQQTDYPPLTDDRRIISIEGTDSFATQEQNSKDGSMVFVSSAVLTYFKKNRNI